MLLKILLAGTGGQGVQTIGQILSEAAFKSGEEVSLISNYGLEQRGGMSLIFLQIGDKAINNPRFTKPDYLFLMSETARPRITRYLKATKHFIEADKFKEILTKEQLPDFTFNTFILGVLAKRLEKFLDKDLVKEFLAKKLKEKKGWEENEKAFEVGYKL